MKLLDLILLLLLSEVIANDETTRTFVRDFLANENIRTPTTVVMHHLCWGECSKLQLTRSLSAIDVRSSSRVTLGNSYQKHTMLILFDLSCQHSEDILHQAINVGLLKTPYRWLVLHDGTSDIGYFALMNAPLLVNTDVVLARRYNSTFHMTELHRPSMNYSMVAAERGWWNHSGITDTRRHKEFYRRRKNLMLKPLVMSNVLIGVNTTVEKAIAENKTDVDSLTNIFSVNAKLAFEMLNATHSQIYTADCGFDLGNDNWTGVIRDFQTGRADLGTSCYMSHGRMNKMDYGDTGASVDIKFIFRQPSLSNVANIFILPFTTTVWIASMVMLILCGIGLYFATKWEFRCDFNENKTIPDGSWGDVLLLTMGAVCQQGCDVEPKRASGRIILLILCMSLMALYAAYSANIVVLLQASSDSIKTLQQLHDSKLTLAAYDIHYNHFWLKSANDTDLHRSIYRKITGKDGRQNFYSLNEGVERLRQGMFALHSITEHIYTVIDRKFLESEKCDLVEMEYIMYQEVFPSLPKGSPNRELFKVAFKQIIESGLFAANELRLRTRKPKCSGSLVTFSSVGFTAFYPSLVFMTYGVVLSIVILFFEITVHRLTIKRRLKAQITSQ